MIKTSKAQLPQNLQPGAEMDDDLADTIKAIEKRFEKFFQPYSNRLNEMASLKDALCKKLESLLKEADEAKKLLKNFAAEQ